MTVFCKGLLLVPALFPLVFLGACSTNPATGRTQFDGLLSPRAEASIGAEQHEGIIKQYGGVYPNTAIQSYVNDIGQRVARNTERPDVTYRFTVLDSPIVNAFALPGGYIYVTRGLLAVANDEAELASVLGHEVGHVTARHQAARYSQGILTTLGATIIGAAVGDASVTRALGVGSNLYMSSYSRDQESEADLLGIRYLSRAGYDPRAMADFLQAMGRYTSTEDRLNGKGGEQLSYLSTHPQTAERVAAARAQSKSWPAPTRPRGEGVYLQTMRGMTYGDSVAQGFVKGRTFYHPQLGFAFNVPPGYQISNQPSRVAAAGPGGTLIVFDRARNARNLDPLGYLVQDWMQGERMNNPENIAINGMSAATDSFPGTMNGRPVDIRIVAIEWARGEVYRFQIAIPKGVGGEALDDLKAMTYSFRRLSGREVEQIRPQRLDLVTAKAGDTVEGLARLMSVENGAVERFLALNNLNPGAGLQSGRAYKIVSDR